MRVVLYSPRPGYGNRGRGRGNTQQPRRSLRELWPGYLEGGYFDEHKHLRPEYVCRERVEPLVRAMCEQPPGLTTHQIRRFFGHCRALETRLRSMGAAWGDVRPLVCKMDAAAADGASKQRHKIPELFHEFIRTNVAAIRTKEDFLEGFLPHFEAVVGFGQRYFKKERS